MEVQNIIAEAVRALSETCAREPIFSRGPKREIPQRDQIIHIIMELRKLMFPGYFSDENSDYFLGNTLTNLWDALYDQLKLAFAYKNSDRERAKQMAHETCGAFIRKLPEIQRMLVKDVEAEFEGDPAAQSREEVIFSYPGMFAIFVYRVAHELYLMKVPFIPRIMTEYAHSDTGIDINAGATIGEYFFIDHGTGIVIGETTEIGAHVKLYQGVTLGALSTRSGQMLAGKKRHPTIEDNVTIYANATILGGDTVIGEGSVIGGNTFITWPIAPKSKVTRDMAPPPNKCSAAGGAR